MDVNASLWVFSLIGGTVANSEKGCYGDVTPRQNVPRYLYSFRAGHKGKGPRN